MTGLFHSSADVAEIWTFASDHARGVHDAYLGESWDAINEYQEWELGWRVSQGFMWENDTPDYRTWERELDIRDRYDRGTRV